MQNCLEKTTSERRAGDSNPQPLSRHLISSQAAGQFAYPPNRLTNLYVSWDGGKLSGRPGRAMDGVEQRFYRIAIVRIPVLP